jgi:hypothetical protein
MGDIVGGRVSDSPIACKALTVQEVFTGRRYRLDHYQRDYSWEQDDVRHLIADLHKRFIDSWHPTHDRRNVGTYQPYFLGPFVYHDDEQYTFLVDGQQRITTLHLLLIFLGDLLREQEDEASARMLDPLVRITRFGESAYTLDIPERSDFLDTVFASEGYQLPDDASSALRRLWESAEVLREEFPEDLRNEALPYFVDWLLERVCLVGIRAENRDQGWEIYESMNDRGLRLGPIDLLKSFLLSQIDRGQAEADHTWRAMVSGLAAVDVNTPSEFIKTYLVARYARSEDDVARLDGPFHSWVKDNAQVLGLVRPTDYQNLIQAMARDAERYQTLAAATHTYTLELPSVYFNHYNGMTRQFAPILAAAEPRDGSADFKAKAELIAKYLDLYFVRRVVNDLPSEPIHLAGEAVRLVERVRGGVNLGKLRAILAEQVVGIEHDFTAVRTYGLRSNNSRQVRYLLARLTTFVETGCGKSDDIPVYLDTRRPYEIEHIWANHFKRYEPETKTKATFIAYRNRLGALLLLPKSDNASYQDITFEDKVDYYQRQNQLAASLNTKHRDRNAPFNKFVRRQGLEKHFRGFPRFDMKAIDSRQTLYEQLCKRVWDQEVFGQAPELTTRPPQPTTNRTRARYDVGVLDLINAQMIPPSANLVAHRRGETFTATVRPDGQIQIPSGESFRSLSGAGEFLLGTRACQGWMFWRTVIGGKEIPLADIRREALENGRV